ncbi:MAG: hypothetical protein ACRDF7_05195 [Candidatus Limnocylindrales bacterium]
MARPASRRLFLLAGVAVGAVLVVGFGYVEAVRPVSIGNAWAVVGKEAEVGSFEGRRTYDSAFVPEQSGIRFALDLRNVSVLPFTIRLTDPGVDTPGHLDRLVELRVDPPGSNEGSTTTESTVPADVIELPAGGERWVVFVGLFASCAEAASWSPGSSEVRRSVFLEARSLGLARSIELELPFDLQVGAPPTSVCP